MSCFYFSIVLGSFRGSGGAPKYHTDTSGHSRGRIDFTTRQKHNIKPCVFINSLLWAPPPNLVYKYYLLCIHLLWSKETENPQNQGCSLILFFWVFVLVWESFRGSWANPEYPPWPLSRGLPFRARPSPLRIPLMCFLFFVFIGARKPAFGGNYSLNRDPTLSYLNRHPPLINYSIQFINQLRWNRNCLSIIEAI